MVSVGSDSFCRGGAIVIISPFRPWSSVIGLPIWGDVVHCMFGVLFLAFLLSKRKSSDDGKFVHFAVCRMS